MVRGLKPAVSCCFLAIAAACSGASTLDPDTGADADTDTDAGSGTDVPDETWQDEATGLTWQRDGAPATFTWQEAVDYCDALVLGGNEDWRLPDIAELIGLLRGCVDGTETGDLSPSACAMIPPGCVESDSCEDKSECAYCPSGSGPTAGCYWDPALGGTCSTYFSSSLHGLDLAWSVRFDYGYAYDACLACLAGVRCVRRE